MFVEGMNWGLFAGCFLIVVGSIMSIVFASFLIKQFVDTKKIYNTKQYIVVEGNVYNYFEYPKVDVFYGNKIKFAISLNEISCGYSKSSPLDDNIRPGRYVRISYYQHIKDDGNDILKLETE